LFEIEIEACAKGIHSLSGYTKKFCAFMFLKYIKTLQPCT
jgi:hypothetical protein